MQDGRRRAARAAGLRLGLFTRNSGNMVRQVMLEAADRQQVDVRRISFVDAWRWLQSAKPGDPLPKLVVNPYRPNRLEPRVRKRRPKQYSLMTKTRCQLKKELDS